jgi:hypothetical protein
VIGYRWHDPEISSSFLDCQHVAYRLQDPPCGKGEQCRLHRRDQLVPVQQVADALLIQIQHYFNPSQDRLQMMARRCITWVRRFPPSVKIGRDQKRRR